MEVQVDPKIEEFTRTQHKLLIDGEWVEAASGKTFETINPATEEILGEAAHREEEDVDRAVRDPQR